MPNTWEDRGKVDVLMRLQALRVVKEEKIDGVVMFADDSNMHKMMDKRKELEEEESSSSLPVQGPACNATDKLVGWHVFNTLPYAGKIAVYIDDVAAVLPQKL
ncbi:hypothetical protein F2Q70_00013613 [Brassica cretica]|uniref:Glycosyltransferases n=1 Tax=Brassica cretica TaxID=69181 RepID=A0A8S9M1L8_BRACR|nr:hypothetical protein F2Q70_00013613 [Brassica cretica]